MSLSGLPRGVLRMANNATLKITTCSGTEFEVSWDTDVGLATGVANLGDIFRSHGWDTDRSFESLRIAMQRAKEATEAETE